MAGERPPPLRDANELVIEPSASRDTGVLRKLEPVSIHLVSVERPLARSVSGSDDAGHDADGALVTIMVVWRRSRWSRPCESMLKEKR